MAHVLEGSVRQAANTIRVTAQLIRADNGYHLWSETYDRDLKDVFKVQDEIAGAVVNALKLKLAPARQVPSSHRTSMPEAGGLDQEAAEGEAAGAASSPSQKICYITGKWQIMRLLGRYRDSQEANFRLGAFHDQLMSYGSLPLSVIEWLLFDDDSSVRKALQ